MQEREIKHRAIRKEIQFTLFVENMMLYSVLLRLLRIQLAVHIGNNYPNAVAFLCMSNKMREYCMKKVYSQLQLKI